MKLNPKRWFTALAAAQLIFSIPAMAAIFPGSVAHQGIHKLEKMAQDGNLDKAYLSNFHDVSLAPLSGQANGAVYQVTLRQVGETAPPTLVLTYDSHGKNLEHTVVAGNTDGRAPVWPEASSVTLAENAFHFLIGNADSHPELQPFLQNFTSETLTQVKDASGNVQAQVVFHASTTSQVLRVLLNTKAEVQQGNVVNP